MATTNKLRFSFKFAYGVGQAGEGIFGTGLGFFLLFYYSQILELSPGLAGTAIGIAVIVDAFSDMIAGSVSDHWRSRLGRRHPFMYASFIPLSCVFFLLFFPFKKNSDIQQNDFCFTCHPHVFGFRLFFKSVLLAAVGSMILQTDFEHFALQISLF